jgi:formyltetrahydrofolate deformylase
MIRNQPTKLYPFLAGKICRLNRSFHYATLRILGADQPGIVAAVSGILDRENCAILKSEQFTDLGISGDGRCPVFFQRIVFETSAQSRERQLTTGTHPHIPFTYNQKMSIQSRMSEMVSSFQLDLAALNWRENRPRVAIMVSKYEHCLWELLLRHQQGELACDISAIISNHSTLEYIAQTFGVPFHHVPIVHSSMKGTQEQQVLHLLQNIYRVDTLILARYMQILSKEFISAFDQQISQTHHVITGHDKATRPVATPQIINIHHSFLPAFIGGLPYHQAHSRGVKLIGATVSFNIVSTCTMISCLWCNRRIYVSYHRHIM